jgi:hypothetical protein
MAKALLFLQADGAPDTLASHLQQGIDSCFTGMEHVAARLMRHLQPDPLSNPQSRHPCPDLVLEVLTASGQPFSSTLPALREALAAGNIAGERSLGLLMHSRNFVSCTPQPINIHYLMVRRNDLCPADYNDYYSHYHSRFGIRMQGIEGYSQHYIDQSGSKQLCQELGLHYREVTSVSEMNTCSMETLLNSPSMVELPGPTTEDELRFVDRDLSVMYSSQVCHVHGDPAVALATPHTQYYDGPELA